MLRQAYQQWHTGFLCLVFLISCVYSLPNLYQDQPAVTVDVSDTTKVQSVQEHLRNWQRQQVDVDTPISTVHGQQIIIRFNSIEQQMLCKDYLRKHLDSSYQISLSLLPTTPQWLRSLGAYPMKLGLDLRGGVHLLLHVATPQISSSQSFSQESTLEWLRGQGIRYQRAQMSHTSQGVHVQFASVKQREIAERLIRKDSRYRVASQAHTLEILPPEQETHARQAYVLNKTIDSLQKRVNELGLSEAIVQRQGDKHISIELPGIQDINKAKAILGNTATLRFHLVAEDEDQVWEVNDQAGRRYSLQKSPILTGDAITYAQFSLQDASPLVQVELGGGGENRFHTETANNIGRNLAIVLQESVTDPTSGQRILQSRVISAPKINQGLRDRFVISGIESAEEATTLALLLRSGSLAAPVDIVQESTLGPSLGAENIRNGLLSLAVGLGSIVSFMVVYYRRLGLIANAGLLLNLLMMVCLLSWLNATMTLPAMAALVLSVGMAVDANVLINERIREELRAGKSDSQALTYGYERAFATILDANITTLIVSGVLFSLSSGMIKGFAITLIIGLIVSMFTSVYATRVLVWSLFPYLGRIHQAVGI